MGFPIILLPLEREKALGFAADFCHVCRKIRAFEIVQINCVLHFYFIPLGGGKFVEHRRRCRSCHAVSSCHLGQYTSVARKLEKTMRSLADATFPTVYEVYKERLETEKRVASAESEEDLKLRKNALMEVFHQASAHFEHGVGIEGRNILARGLKPLNPTEEEVRECLLYFRELRSKMGAKVQTAEVMDSIRPQKKEIVAGQYDY